MRLLVAALLLAACTQTPGVEATFCEGHADGVAGANRVATQAGLPGPVNPPCDTGRVDAIPQDPTPADVYCYGWIAGYTAVALSHFPDQPPSTAWMASTFDQCVAAQP